MKTVKIYGKGTATVVVADADDIREFAHQEGGYLSIEGDRHALIIVPGTVEGCWAFAVAQWGEGCPLPPWYTKLETNLAFSETSTILTLKLPTAAAIWYESNRPVPGSTEHEADVALTFEQYCMEVYCLSQTRYGLTLQAAADLDAEPFREYYDNGTSAHAALASLLSTHEPAHA